MFPETLLLILSCVKAACDSQTSPGTSLVLTVLQALRTLFRNSAELRERIQRNEFVPEYVPAC